ncbi:MAG: PEP-CTERM sorting domain-containing protein [Sedimentisphaerales bacterium]|nr:PEP-CTERM sorting domain-containing protein [Sedimentisphaerales bacterium]
MGWRKTLGIAFSLLALVMAEAPAGILMFTHEGNGSGTLGGNAFPASDFVITAVGDTDDRLSFEYGWWINHISASILIDGVGDFDILTGTRTFVNNDRSIVGFSRAKDLGGRGPDLFDGPTDAAFDTWDMLGPIGPISGSGSLMQWTLTPLINTTGGILIFDSDSGVSTTFAAVPEPATICLLGLGGFLLRRKRNA